MHHLRWHASEAARVHTVQYSNPTAQYMHTLLRVQQIYVRANRVQTPPAVQYNPYTRPVQPAQPLPVSRQLRCSAWPDNCATKEVDRLSMFCVHTRRHRRTGAEKSSAPVKGYWAAVHVCMYVCMYSMGCARQRLVSQKPRLQQQQQQQAAHVSSRHLSQK